MLSTPPATTISASPARMACAALCTACSPEPHWRMTVYAGTSTGKPALRAATRARLAASALCFACPKMTSSTTSGVHPGTLDRRQDHDLGELLRRHVLQRAADPAERGTDRGDDDDFSHVRPHAHAYAMLPPSMLRTVPVTKSDAADARKTTGPTMSATVAMRPMGTFCSILS